jgi:hypothetical protein
LQLDGDVMKIASRWLLDRGAVPLLCLSVCLAACSDDDKKNNTSDAAADGVRTGGSSGNASGGAPGGGGTTGGGQGGRGGQSGQGGQGAGDAPVSQDMRAGIDIAFPDGTPPPMACPADVATAMCTPDTYCVKSDGSSGCGCLNTGRWFCPPITIGGDGGVVIPDGGIGDAGVSMCPAGTATGVTCTMKATLCTGVGMLGCPCTEVVGGLRWVCY